MKVSVLLTAALGIFAASAATIPAAAQAQAQTQLAAGRDVPLASDEVERRQVGWVAVAQSVAPYIPQIVESVAPHVPKVVDKVGKGLKKLGGFIKSKTKKKKNGKRDGLGGVAEGVAGGAIEEADSDVKGVARRFVA